MIATKKIYLTAQGRNLMRQEGRRVLADPLHPKIHAPFVKVHSTYKLSAVPAQSKHIEALNIP